MEQMKVAFHPVCNAIERPWSQSQTKGEVLENEHTAVQDECQKAMEQPTHGNMEKCILHIQCASPHGLEE